MFWFPIIRGADHVPNTEFVHFDYKKMFIGDDINPVEYADLYYRVETAVRGIGYPAFIRTDITSAKHYGINAVRVTESGDLNVPLLRTLNYNHLKAHWAEDLEPSAIMVREWLDLDAEFTAFEGLPVAKEWRIFAGPDGIQCMHPYWPKSALKGRVDAVEHWEAILDRQEREAPGTKVLMQAAEHVRAIGGKWSVDYAKGKNGYWYLTDMAPAEKSFHAQPCAYSVS